MVRESVTDSFIIVIKFVSILCLLYDDGNDTLLTIKRSDISLLMSIEHARHILNFLLHENNL